MNLSASYRRSIPLCFLKTGRAGALRFYLADSAVQTSLNSDLRVRIRRRFNSWKTGFTAPPDGGSRGAPEASITPGDGEPQLAAAGQTQPESSPGWWR